MTLAGHLESATGQRLLRDSLFEDGQPRREVTMPQREHVFGDYDDPDAAPYGFAPQTRAVAALAAAQMGITPASASRERERYAGRRDAAISQAVLRGGTRPPHPDWYGESTRERAGRYKTGGMPAQFGDEPVAGSLPGYTYAYTAA
jgi:hypothetical protein